MNKGAGPARRVGDFGYGQMPDVLARRQEVDGAGYRRWRHVGASPLRPGQSCPAKVKAAKKSVFMGMSAENRLLVCIQTTIARLQSPQPPGKPWVWAQALSAAKFASMRLASLSRQACIQAAQQVRLMDNLGGKRKLL